MKLSQLHSPLLEMTDEASFHRTIDANPLDSGPRLVFADWLEERGDPRAVGYRWMGENGKGPAIFAFLDPNARTLWRRHSSDYRPRTRIGYGWFHTGMAIFVHEYAPDTGAFAPTDRQYSDLHFVSYAGLPAAIYKGLPNGIPYSYAIAQTSEPDDEEELLTIGLQLINYGQSTNHIKIYTSAAEACEMLTNVIRRRIGKPLLLFHEATYNAEIAKRGNQPVLVLSSRLFSTSRSPNGNTALYRAGKGARKFGLATNSELYRHNPTNTWYIRLSARALGIERSGGMSWMQNGRLAIPIKPITDPELIKVLDHAIAD